MADEKVIQGSLVRVKGGGPLWVGAMDDYVGRVAVVDAVCNLRTDGSPHYTLRGCRCFLFDPEGVDLDLGDPRPGDRVSWGSPRVVSEVEAYERGRELVWLEGNSGWLAKEQAQIVAFHEPLTDMRGNARPREGETYPVHVTTWRKGMLARVRCGSQSPLNGEVRELVCGPFAPWDGSSAGALVVNLMGWDPRVDVRDLEPVTDWRPGDKAMISCGPGRKERYEGTIFEVEKVIDQDGKTWICSKGRKEWLPDDLIHVGAHAEPMVKRSDEESSEPRMSIEIDVTELASLRNELIAKDKALDDSRKDRQALEAELAKVHRYLGTLESDGDGSAVDKLIGLSEHRRLALEETRLACDEALLPLARSTRMLASLEEAHSRLICAFEVGRARGETLRDAVGSGARKVGRASMRVVRVVFYVTLVGWLYYGVCVHFQGVHERRLDTVAPVSTR